MQKLYIAQLCGRGKQKRKSVFSDLYGTSVFLHPIIVEKVNEEKYREVLVGQEFPTINQRLSEDRKIGVFVKILVPLLLTKPDEIDFLKDYCLQHENLFLWNKDITDFKKLMLHYQLEENAFLMKKRNEENLSRLECYIDNEIQSKGIEI